MKSSPIRPAVPADLPSIDCLIREAYEGYVPRMRGRRPAPMQENYADLVAGGSVEVLDDNVGLAGMIVLLELADHLLLDNIAVRRDRRGSGIGRQLFLHAEQRARGAGYRELRLYTAEAMIENIALYRRCGWLEYERAAPTGIPRVYMRKPLD